MKHNTAVIDLSNIIFANYHTSKGYMEDRPVEHHTTDIIITTLRSISVAVEATKASIVICATDAGGKPEYRKTISGESYKAGRSETPDAIRGVFRVVTGVLANYGIVPLTVKGYEADDIFAQLAVYYTQKGLGTITGVSRDNDWTLPVARCRGNVALYNQKTKRTLHYHDIQGTTEDYLGRELSSDQVFDAYVLRKAILGDSSDNIAGFHGIGRKTATDLVKYILLRQQDPEMFDSSSFGNKMKALMSKYATFQGTLKKNLSLIDPYFCLEQQPVIDALEATTTKSEAVPVEDILDQLQTANLSKALSRFSKMRTRYSLIEAGPEAVSRMPPQMQDLLK